MREFEGERWWWVVFFGNDEDVMQEFEGDGGGLWAMMRGKKKIERD